MHSSSRPTSGQGGEGQQTKADSPAGEASGGPKEDIDTAAVGSDDVHVIDVIELEDPPKNTDAASVEPAIQKATTRTKTGLFSKMKSFTEEKAEKKKAGSNIGIPL
jgi:hypothetical protein